MPRSITVAVLEMRGQGTVDTEARTFIRLGRHTRLVKFYGQCVEGDNQLLVIEFAETGSLSDAFEELTNEDGESTVTLAHRLAMLSSSSTSPQEARGATELPWYPMSVADFG